MKNLIYFLTISACILLLNCTEKKEKIPFELYYKMDIWQKTDKQLNPRTTLTIPFSHNQIYDPFVSVKKKANNQKSSFEKRESGGLAVYVLDTIQSRMNAQTRKQKRPDYIKAYPVIIENTKQRNSSYLELHRGCALIIQQIKTDKNQWIDIEKKTKEKLGDFYYKIKPKQYIYTKTPIYRGADTVELRIKLISGDSIYYSNPYKGSVPKWIKRKSQVTNL